MTDYCYYYARAVRIERTGSPKIEQFVRGYVIVVPSRGWWWWFALPVIRDGSIGEDLYSDFELFLCGPWFSG